MRTTKDWNVIMSRAEAHVQCVHVMTGMAAQVEDLLNQQISTAVSVH